MDLNPSSRLATTDISWVPI